MASKIELSKLETLIGQFNKELLELQAIIKDMKRWQYATIAFETKKIFKLDNYKGNYIMYCKTKEEADNFCKYLHKHNKHWASGNSYLNTSYWEMEKNGICYLFNDDLYMAFDYIKENYYIILNYSDFDWENSN